MIQNEINTFSIKKILHNLHNDKDRNNNNRKIFKIIDSMHDLWTTQSFQDNSGYVRYETQQYCLGPG